MIVEHFYHNTRKQLNYKAKAMVVTASRLHAVKYYLEMKKYIKKRGYESDIKPLVAFSGSVKDEGKEHTEASLNGFSDKEIPEKFDKDGYNILTVAYKFQTGFDQPLLHTMYVDQRLKSVKAVQTLSRLNRIYPGKTDTFVIYFVNTSKEIQEAFEPYYIKTEIDESSDPNQLYDLKSELDSFQIYWKPEIDNFAKIFFRAIHA